MEHAVLISFLGLFGGGLIAWGSLTMKVKNHCQNGDIHNTYEKNSQLFVPREENKITVLANKERFDSLDKNIDEIKCDVKKLLQRG